ncbi:MAG: glycosyltransferase family 4 protein [Verrucomicrobiota bacterium]
MGYAAATFARELTARGWSIAIATSNLPGGPAEEEKPEGSVRQFNINGDASIWFPLSGDVTALEQWIAAQAPDIVVIHGWQGWGVRFVPKLQTLGIPVILQSHGFGMHRMEWKLRPPFGLKIWFGYQPFVWRLPAFIKNLAALSVLSEMPRFLTGFDHWIGEKFKCRNVVNIPNGVEPVKGNADDFFDICPEAKGKFIVLCIANYCDRKNQLRMLEVARELDSEELYFVFIGGEENHYLRMLRAKADEWQLTRRVALIHGISRSLAESAIMASDAALMASKWEMQPLFLLEAMSAKKPWISTDVGSVRELRGGMISDSDAARLAEKITALLHDDVLRESLSREGHEQWQSRFSPRVVYDRWHNLMRSVISRNPTLPI